MTTSVSFDDLKQRILERCDALPDDVAMDTRIDDLGIESRDLASILVDLEEAYAIEFRPGEIGSLIAVGDLHHLLLSKLAPTADR